MIQRDLKSFIFELILPFAIILLSLFLLRISFVEDFPARALTIDTYLSDQNPVLVPIGSDNGVLGTNLQNSLKTKYGSKVSVELDPTNTVVTNFDKDFLHPKKLAIKTLKGGIFFTNGPTTVAPNDFY